MSELICQYCGKVCKNKAGKTLHENKCPEKRIVMPPMRSIAFIDAGQFRPSILINKLQLSTDQRFDWEKFKLLLDVLSGGHLFDAHYFDAPEANGSTRQVPFHRMLKNGLGFHLHFSDLREKRYMCQRCQNSHIEYEQKGVDVAMTVSMMKLAYSGAYDQVLLCSGDGDFAPLVEYLRDSLGKRVIVVCWKENIAAALKDAAYRVETLEDHRARIVSDKADMVRVGAPA